MSFQFIDIRHSYGERRVLSGINLEAQPGEITCLLGPSGCGKTTLLRLAAGLIPVQDGEIRLEGRLIADRTENPPPERRAVGLVFQDGALFPHMTVSENIGFGVEDSEQASERVRKLLDQVGLAEFASVYPFTLSGGQQQRVALARAMAANPDVLLLDEPFASVDVVLRRSLREDTRRLLKARNAVTLMVTHDPEEAMDIGDQIALMAEGRIVQSGSPSEVYDNPATAAAAALFGGGQILRGRRTEAGVETSFGLWPISACRGATPASGSLDLVVRPDALVFDSDGEELRVEDVRIQGAVQRIVATTSTGERIAAQISREAAIRVGQTASLTPMEGSIFAFAAD